MFLEKDLYNHFKLPQSLISLCIKQEELSESGYQNEQENEMIVIKEDLFWGE